ncbi:MAG: amidohydrolase family protein [Clostridia bacterium]|nr:amidohydrolase family protein [Clostridia bacterium]
MQILQLKEYNNLIILAGTLIDNVQAVPHPATALSIKEGRITGIEPNYLQEQLPTETRPKVINLTELTLLPAFIDCHVHLALDGLDFHAALNRWTPDQAWLPQVKEALKTYLNHGIAVIRDGGDGANIGLQTKNLFNQGDITGPRILASGQAIYKKGRYGSFLGPGISSIQEACQMVTSLYHQGADWIKILVSGIVSFQEYGKVGPVQFSQQELNYIVDHAHSMGLPVMAHASSDEAVAMAARAGVDSIEHGYFITTSSLAILAEKNIPWIPTIVPVANQVVQPFRANHPTTSLDIITKTYKLQLQKIAQGAALGVPLGIGTDAGASGVLHGFSYHRELELFAQAGLSPAAIIKAATLVPARILGLDHELGAVEPGKKPCLIGVRGNPLEDPAVLKKVEFLLY